MPSYTPAVRRGRAQCTGQSLLNRLRPIILSVAGVCAIFTPSVASTLVQANLLAESAVSSVWLTNTYCEIRDCPAEAIVEGGFDVVRPHAVGQRSSKARPAVHAAACPP